jgi:hypothetical protein
VKKVGLRRNVLLSTIVMLTVLVLTVHPVQATVYSAHAEDWSGLWDVYLTADTSAHTLKLKWTAPAYPPPYYWGSYIHVWDDLGNTIYWIDYPLGTHIPVNGEKTFTYHIRGTWVHAEVRWSHSIGAKYIFFQVTVRCDLYIGNGGGGGCPTLFAWNGTNYACEGLLDIHNPEGVDMICENTLVSTPQRVNGAYLFRLVEHPKTHSFIDQVKLYATLEDETMIELPLIHAWHSEDGNVLPQLLFSDECKTDTLGADLNNGTSESIDLKFASPSPNLETIGFVFQIEGNNMLPK